jgi:hypothetical protein
MSSSVFGGARARLAIGLAAAAALSALAACSENLPDRPREDRDGVNRVPPPSSEASGGGEACTDDADCDDADACTLDACVGGFCANTDASDDGNPCTDDSCDPTTGDVKNAPIEVMPDGLACTLDVCDPATGTKFPEAIALFVDDFADATSGWTLDEEWAIGPTMATMGAVNEGNDPALDASDTNDNGVAATGLGAFISNTAHDARYLTSPPIAVGEVDLATEKVVLDYARWLNLDDRGVASVEVFDGAAWTTLDSISTGVLDALSGWTPKQHDVTAAVAAAKAANKPIQVRFGLSRLDGGGAVGGFTLDDVQLERRAAACP